MCAPPANLTRDCARSRFDPLKGVWFPKRGSAGDFTTTIYIVYLEMYLLNKFPYYIYKVDFLEYVL